MTGQLFHLYVKWDLRNLLYYKMTLLAIEKENFLYLQWYLALIDYVETIDYFNKQDTPKQNKATNKLHVRSSRPEVFLGKGVLKICNKFTGENLCQSVIQKICFANCSPVNLQHIFQTLFPKNTSGRLLL